MRIFLAGCLLLLLMLLGFVGGYSVFVIIQHAPLGPWETFVTEPPLTFEKILADTGLTTYLLASDGKTYACWWYTHLHGVYRAKCSNDVVTEVKQGNLSCKAFLDEFQISTPPGAVVDFVETYACGPDGAVKSKLIITEDGRLWRWSKSSGLGELSAALGYSVIGAVVLPVGILIVLVSLRVSKKMKRR